MKDIYESHWLSVEKRLSEYNDLVQKLTNITAQAIDDFRSYVKESHARTCDGSISFSFSYGFFYNIESAEVFCSECDGYLVGGDSEDEPEPVSYSVKSVNFENRSLLLVGPDGGSYSFSIDSDPKFLEAFDNGLVFRKDDEVGLVDGVVHFVHTNKVDSDYKSYSVEGHKKDGGE